MVFIYEKWNQIKIKRLDFSPLKETISSVSLYLWPTGDVK